MRIIGLDLALTGSHKALIADERGQPLTSVLTVPTTASELQRLLDRAREHVAPTEELVLVLEPTGMAWFPVAAFALRQAHVTVYLVNSQQVADLRRYYQKHPKSDRIDARVLVKLPVLSPEKLHPLYLPSANQLACQRGCKELDRLMSLHTAIQNRLQAVDRFAWPGVEAILPGTLNPQRRWFREHWYDPRRYAKPGPCGCGRPGRVRAARRKPPRTIPGIGRPRWWPWPNRCWPSTGRTRAISTMPPCRRKSPASKPYSILSRNSIMPCNSRRCGRAIAVCTPAAIWKR